MPCDCDVAPFTGAWIETSDSDTVIVYINGVVAPFTGAWIETAQSRCWPPSGPVAPFTGAWIETPPRQQRVCDKGRPLHGGVDRNQRYIRNPYSFPIVAPFTGAWIETGAGR